MNEMYVLLAVATVLPSVFIPIMYLRIKKKNFFEVVLRNKFLECEINGYRTMDKQERQILKEYYITLKKRNLKILTPVIVFSAIATVTPILSNIIRIPAWVFYIYIGIIAIIFISIEAYVIMIIIEIFSKKFRKFKKRIICTYIYKYVDKEIFDVIIEGSIGLTLGGILMSIFIPAIIGAICLLNIEIVWQICNLMLMLTNIRVAIYISKKLHKYLEQTIIDEAGLL